MLIINVAKSANARWPGTQGPVKEMMGWEEAGLKGKFQAPSLWDRTQEVGKRLREGTSQGWEKVDHNFLSSIFSLFLAANTICLPKGSSVHGSPLLRNPRWLLLLTGGHVL